MCCAHTHTLKQHISDVQHNLLITNYYQFFSLISFRLERGTNQRFVTVINVYIGHRITATGKKKMYVRTLLTPGGSCILCNWCWLTNLETIPRNNREQIGTIAHTFGANARRMFTQMEFGVCIFVCVNHQMNCTNIGRKIAHICEMWASIVVCEIANNILDQHESLWETIVTTIVVC